MISALQFDDLHAYLSLVRIALQSSLLQEYLSLVRMATQSSLTYQIDENAQAVLATVNAVAKIKVPIRLGFFFIT